MVDTIQEDQQALWNSVVAERETGVKPAASEPQATTVEGTTGTENQTPDPLAELRKIVDAIDHRTKSTEGRIGAIDKTVKESLLAASKAATQQVASAPSQS